MTIKRVYKKQFETRAQARAYYNALAKNPDLAGRSHYYYVPAHCYEVAYYFKKDVVW